MATYFGSDDEEGPPEFIGLEALPPPEAAPVASALEAAQEHEERLQPFERVSCPHGSTGSSLATDSHQHLRLLLHFDAAA